MTESLVSMLKDARREELITALAQRIEQAGMVAPAILFLETFKPLAFLGAQLVWLAQPFLTLGLKETDVRDLAQLIEDEDGVEALIARLEASQSEKT
ncbi:MAG: hypothetical protein N2559_01165 [Anaerolineae bacterium]|nr:hypothetical protein [Anaerolineae bacterium]